MNAVFSSEIFFNSTTCDWISSSLSCLIFSLSSNSFLSFSSLAFLTLSSFAFSSSSLFFFSFSYIHLTLFSFSRHNTSRAFLLLFAYQALETFQASLVLSFVFLSLIVHSRASPNCSSNLFLV